MKITRCPDCSTGWLYAEDLPQRHHHNLSHEHGLVKCPTCNGQGRMLEPDDPPAVMRATVTASSVQPVRGVQPVCEQLPITSAYQIAALHVKNDVKWEPIPLYAAEGEPMPLYATKDKNS